MYAKVQTRQSAPRREVMPSESLPDYGLCLLASLHPPRFAWSRAPTPVCNWPFRNAIRNVKCARCFGKTFALGSIIVGIRSSDLAGVAQRVQRQIEYPQTFLITA